MRYYTLESYNQQLAVAPSFYNYISKRYNANTELFASSINSTLTNYCSLFYDVEKHFNSRGSFNGMNVVKGMYVANPPFSNDIMTVMANRIIDWLDKTNQDLGFVVTIPAWDKEEEKYGRYEPFFILKASKYLVNVIKIPKYKAYFVDYISYREIRPVDVYVILLQNKASKNKYRINLGKDIYKYWKPHKFGNLH
jgi:hypothetical protein